MLALAAAGGLASMPAFFAAVPYAAIKPERLLEALRFEANHYATGQITQFAAGPNTFGWNLEFLYYTGLGPGMALMALLGLVWAAGRIVSRLGSSRTPPGGGAGARSRLCGEVLFLAYPLIVLGFLARYVVRFDRNLLPVLPFAAILAAVFAGEVWRALNRLRAPGIRRAGRGVWGLALCLSIAYPLSRDVVFDAQILEPHTRRQLKKWIERLPEGVTVKNHGFRQKSLAWLQAHGYDYVVMSSHSWEPVAAQPERFKRLAKWYRELFDTCKVVAVFRNPWFASDFFAPHRLLNSATVNIYHGPTLMVLEVPKPTKERKKRGKPSGAGATRSVLREKQPSGKTGHP